MIASTVTVPVSWVAVVGWTAIARVNPVLLGLVLGVAQANLARDLEGIVLPSGASLSFPDASNNSTFVVTFQPHEHLSIKAPVAFEFRVPLSYAAMPPAVTCIQGWEGGCPVEVDDGGRLKLNILQLGDAGWIRGYTLSDVIHCIHQKLQLADYPHVKVIASPGTSTSRSGAAGPLLLSGEFGLQGKRPTMEDQTVCIDRLSLADASRKISYYAVFDGHGGAVASKYASDNLHRHFGAFIDAGQTIRCARWRLHGPVRCLCRSHHCIVSTGVAARPFGTRSRPQTLALRWSTVPRAPVRPLGIRLARRLLCWWWRVQKSWSET
jgi:hypothetical protein